MFEFTRSQTASRYGIDNTPPPDAVNEIYALVANVLQPLRDMLGRPIYISSGYRCPELNRRIGGATNSQHMAGQAADIECFEIGNVALFDFIRYNFIFDQLILEQYVPSDGINSGWVHISHRSLAPNNGGVFRFP